MADPKTKEAAKEREPRKRVFRKIVQPEAFGFEEIGDSYEGIFAGVKEVPFTDKRGTRLAPLYTLQPEGEDPIGVWGSPMLKDMMSQVGIGQYVRITFTGTKPAKEKGFSPMKVYEVEVEE